jgi:hypothetical protein
MKQYMMLIAKLINISMRGLYFALRTIDQVHHQDARRNKNPERRSFGCSHRLLFTIVQDCSSSTTDTCQYGTIYEDDERTIHLHTSAYVAWRSTEGHTCIRKGTKGPSIHDVMRKRKKICENKRRKRTAESYTHTC